MSTRYPLSVISGHWRLLSELLDMKNMTAAQLVSGMVTSPEQVEAMRSQFHARIQPLVDLKASILEVAMPQFILDARSLQPISANLKPEVQGLLDDCDAVIQEIADQFLVNL